VECATARGLRAYGGTQIGQFEHGRSGVVLHTDRGARVTARKLVVAAGYESQQYLRRTLVKLRSTYALATASLEHFDERYQQALIWETGHPYHYLRTTRDQRIIIGGEDEDLVNAASRDRVIHTKVQALQTKIAKWFPELSVKTDYAWAGTFGETKDGLPFIGSVRGLDNVLFALCYGANGTNFGILAANLIRDRILGRRNPDASLFSLDR
jgi:glycine/D-amino acid oxidase-like deaminating enzyme